MVLPVDYKSQGYMPIYGMPGARPPQDKTIPGRRQRLLRNFVLLTIVSLAVTLYINRLTSIIGGAKVTKLSGDPADEWQDNVYPIREQTPWDISTDYPHPRKLEYDVAEGTWLRLDVHPKSGDIVFDMVGDIYCLPGNEAALGTRVAARPVLRGVPHDSDPRFSPEGDRIVFRSDAELGVENIWVMEWKGCEKMGLAQGDIVEASSEETHDVRALRLEKEGRLGAQRVTNETYRWVSDARFHPSGSKVVATKWYTTSRSLGAGEGWEYSVPSLEDLRLAATPKVSSGSGQRVLGRSLPLGWTAEDYGEQQIGPEQILYHGSDSLIFSPNVIDQSEFVYSKDVHKGIYAIFRKNLTTGITETLEGASPGGASRPEVSRDGRTLAFVRRVRDKEALVVKDLVTGSIYNVWYGLTHDLTIISAPMGTYPSFAFSPRDEAVIIWAAGQIYRVPLSVNQRGERLAGGAPRAIPFTAHIEKRLAQTLRGGATNLVDLESAPTQRVLAFKELRVNERGDKAVFQGAGATYLTNVYESDTTRIPVLYPGQAYFSPSFIHGHPDLVVHARWSDTNFTTFEISDVASKRAYELEGLPMGRYFSPVLCECESAERQIAFVKSGGDWLTGDVFATAKPGLYLGSLTLPFSTTVKHGTAIPIRNVTFVRSKISVDDQLSMKFMEGNKKLLVHQSQSSLIIDLSAGPDKHGNYPHQTIARGELSQEIAASVTKKSDGSYGLDHVAFVDTFHVYVAPGSSVKDGQAVWAKPANSTKGLARLSVDGGHDIVWSGDGKKLFWFLGPYLHSIEVVRLSRCATTIKQDRLNFGISCVKDLLYYQELRIEHSTDIARMKKEASSLQPNNANASNSDLVIVLNATLLTMSTGREETDIVKGGILVVRGGIIDAVATLDSFTGPAHQGAMVIDAKGGFLVPGFIDVHAHWNGFAARFPSKSWEMETFLAYGVTTVHNPSADTVLAPIERSRVESGQMIGPRIFTVGGVIYGAGERDHQDAADLAEAKSVLTRIKAEAGPFGISYKNYNLPSRASRQRLLSAARNLSMLCVPEGGMNYDWDLTYIIDGMTTVEHALPIPTLYEDVLILYALSGTGSTPTHVVNYGGAWGEQLVWATEDIPNDPKLRRFTRHDILEALTESTARPKHSYALFNTSTSVARMVEKGLLANIGAHGEPPLGLNYHAEMEFTRAGGLTRYETLRAATIDGAKTLGLDHSIGSIEAGKLADFLIYPPGVDLLKGDSGRTFSTVGPTRDIRLVVRGGRIWNASTMEEVWPTTGRTQNLPTFNAD